MKGTETNRDYTEIIKGYYTQPGNKIKGVDLLTNKAYTENTLKERPDIQQRIEKAINSNTYLAIYKRGTRNGFEFMSKTTADKLLNKPTSVMGAQKQKWNDVKPPSNFFINELKWKYLVRNIEKGKNIMMTGPAGCGKTDATFHAAKALGREVIYFNLGATQDPRSTLIGNTHFSKDTGTYFSESLFVNAIQTENAVILLDELSRAHPEAWNILMTVLDPIQRYLRLDEKDDSPTIKVAKGVSFIATANIGMEYTATRVLDRALLDRFSIFEMDVLNDSQEFSVLKGKYPQLQDEVLLSLCSIVGDLRGEVKTNSSKISTMISTRSTIEIAELLSDGFDLDQAAELLIYPLFPNEGGVDSERTYVKQIVQKHISPESKIDKPDDLFNLDELGL